MNHSPREKLAELTSHHITVLETTVRGVVILFLHSSGAGGVGGGGSNKGLAMSLERCGSPERESCSASGPLVLWPHSAEVLSVPESSVPGVDKMTKVLWKKLLTFYRVSYTKVSRSCSQGVTAHR